MSDSATVDGRMRGALSSARLSVRALVIGTLISAFAQVTNVRQPRADPVLPLLSATGNAREYLTKLRRMRVIATVALLTMLETVGFASVWLVDLMYVERYLKTGAIVVLIGQALAILAAYPALVWVSIRMRAWDPLHDAGFAFIGLLLAGSAIWWNWPAIALAAG